MFLHATTRAACSSRTTQRYEEQGHLERQNRLQWSHPCPEENQTDRATNCTSAATTQRHFTIYYQNVRSINNKLSTLHTRDLSELDAIILSETWLKPHTFSHELIDTNNYDVYRVDRPGLKIGGGVFIALKNSYKSSQLNLDSLTQAFPDIDFLCVSVNVNSFLFLLLSIYIPPQIDNARYDSFINEMTLVSKLCDMQLLIVGDFNAPGFSDFL